VTAGTSGSSGRFPAVFTIGHGARTIEAFLALVEAPAIRIVVDVRTAPGSRKHPQFGRDALETSLGQRGITYVWRKELGGWRRPRSDSPHTALHSPAFRGYADHMSTVEFHSAMEWLIETSTRDRTAIMCAESLWWRCHRRMIADALTVRGRDVLHVMEGGRIEPHRLSATARVDGTELVYDVDSRQLGLLDGG